MVRMQGAALQRTHASAAHKGGGAYGCAENTMATTAGRGAVPTEHVGGTLSRIDYGVIPQDPDHIR